MKKLLSTYDACAIVEGWRDGDVSKEEYIEATQLLIDSGLWLQLQGTTGRICNSLIEKGLCQLPLNRQGDAYGNLVPSRHENL